MTTKAIRSAVLRWLPATGAGVVLAGVVLAIVLSQLPSGMEPPSAPKTLPGAIPGAQVAPSAAVPPRPEPRTPSVAATASPPSFDVVRVSPDGSAVLAGRAAPGDEVIVRDRGKEVGRAQADAAGAWVLVPQAPLPSGSHELTVAANPLAGGPERGGSGSVIVDVPATGGAAAQQAAQSVPLAVMTGPAGPRVLQGPGTARPGTLGLQGLDYTQQGEMHFGGTAPPGARVRLYIDNRPAGETIAGADGMWALAPGGTVAPGEHRLRLDQIGPGGRVVARTELPFLREDLASRDLSGGSVVVQPGQSLWRIARANYGAGMRYLVIFKANRAQIRDPNLIYPGQVFAVPAHEQVPATLEPAARSAP
jgi:nucleoid-associated protein YgaU